MSSTSDFEHTFDKETKVYQVYLRLQDHQWHCRECEYTNTGITQIAGGSGIQGLQRGTRSRPGIIIQSDNHLCIKCKRTTRHDRWEGGFQTSVQGPSMPPSFIKRAADILESRDIVEGTQRPLNQLTIDHKLPMLRWNADTKAKLTNYSATDEKDIRANFQLLQKSNGSVSHNQLKSRACERCFKQGRRGTPFGISFFYAGNDQWAPEDPSDPKGCEGCGWYDFGLWRQHLNARLKQAQGG